MRIRTVKPEFFLHEGLYDLELETGLPIRVAFVGLWCAADREGRFRWSERRLKASILPYDDVDFARVLHALGTRGFLVKYASKGEWFGVIPSFKKHQVINNKERASDLPEVTQPEPFDAWPTREARDEHAFHKEGKGREGKGKEGNKTLGESVGGASPTSKEDKAPTLTDAEWLLQLSADPAYEGIDVHREHRKMIRWCEVNRKTPSRRRFLNWLNRAERPMDGKAPNEHPNDRNLGGGSLWDATAPGDEDDTPDFSGDGPALAPG